MRRGRSRARPLSAPESPPATGLLAAIRGARPKGRRSGFTLLEAAVALTILGVVAIGAFGAYGAQLRADRHASEILPAASLATDRLAALELLEALGDRPLPDSLARGRFAAPLDIYEWEATIRPVGPREPGLHDIRVTVRWARGAYTLYTRRWRDPRTPPRDALGRARERGP